MNTESAPYASVNSCKPDLRRSSAFVRVVDWKSTATFVQMRLSPYPRGSCAALRIRGVVAVTSWVGSSLITSTLPRPAFGLERRRERLRFVSNPGCAHILTVIARITSSRSPNRDLRQPPGAPPCQAVPETARAPSARHRREAPRCRRRRPLYSLTNYPERLRAQPEPRVSVPPASPRGAPAPAPRAYAGLRSISTLRRQAATSTPRWL